jgi:hypothetical protein
MGRLRQLRELSQASGHNTATPAIRERDGIPLKLDPRP